MSTTQIKATFSTALGKAISIGAATPAPQTAFETSFPPAPAALQASLNDFSRAGPSTFAEIVGELDYAGGRFIADPADFVPARMDALLGGPLRADLGDWQAEIKMAQWDSCVERRLVLAAPPSITPPQVIKRLYYSFTSDGTLLLRRQTPPSRVGLSPALTLLSSFFRRLGLRVFARQPSEDPSQADAFDVLAGVQYQAPPFSVSELFTLIENAKEPLKELEINFFGNTADKLALPASLFVVMRGIEEEASGETRIAVWLFKDANAEANLTAMDAARWSDTTVLVKPLAAASLVDESVPLIPPTASDTQMSQTSVVPSTPMLGGGGSDTPSPVAPPSLPAPFGLFGGMKRQRV